MSVAPHAGIIDFGTFTPPEVGKDGIQGEVPKPLIGQESYILTASGWSATVPSSAGVSSFSAGTTGLTPATSTTGAVTLAGTLNVANGGTGAATLTSNALLKGNGTSAISASTVLDDGTNVTTTSNLGVGITYPSYKAQITGSTASTSAIAQSLYVQGGTNIYTYSEQFDNAAWNKSALTISANAALAPDGNTTADKITADTTNAIHWVGNSTPRTGTFAFSVYAKAAGYNTFAFAAASNSSQIVFNLSTGSITSTGGIWSNAAISSVGNGWYRCSGVVTLSSDFIYLSPNTAFPAYTGDGASGTFIWGAQLEQGTTASPYVATTASAINGTSSAYFGGPVTLASTNRSASAWTTSGINLIQSAATFTDTTSTGTVNNVYMNRFNAQTLAATNTITATNLYGTYISAPVAGTNVTATNNYALGVDSLYVGGTATVSQSLFSFGAVNIASTTGSVNASVGIGVTASGSTKNVNIGTNGASGSTTNITLGSATSGATQTTTINGRVTLAPIGASAAAWTTSGIGLVQSAATFTDTTSTGTVANVYMNSFGAQTMAASNVITVTSLYGAYFANPVAGVNVTASNIWALRADSAVIAGSFYIANNGFTLGSSSGTGTGSVMITTGTATLNLHTGTTASGNTKTVNIGTGGASGSTTAITIGSSTSGATQSTTINGTVTLAPIGSSAAAWTTNGIGLIQNAATFTDTTSTGTVANVYMNRFNAQTLAATNTITATNLYGAYFSDPAAGTNVTATNKYSIGADSLNVNGYTFINAGSAGSYIYGFVLIGASAQTQSITVGQSTATSTVNVHTGTTASGSTKTVNIGTGGASGSTTNITLGSSTSGATQTTTVNGQVTLAPIGGSAAAWTTSGIALKQSAATWTDTSSTGTVAAVRMNNFATQTLAASNAMTVSDLYGAYFTSPVAGTNVTANSRWALGVDSVDIGSTFRHTGSLAYLSFSTGTLQTYIATGTTASGNTKTVNIGTGGASGSTTNITIGSSTSGATSTTTLNGKTTFAGTAQLQGYTVATLPAGTQGMTAFVTDALAPAWNTTLVGGGAVVCKAFYNGTNWVAG